jgi:hypothetical protein
MGKKSDTGKDAVAEAAERAEDAIDAVKDKLADPIRKDR